MDSDGDVAGGRIECGWKGEKGSRDNLAFRIPRTPCSDCESRTSGGTSNGSPVVIVTDRSNVQQRDGERSTATWAESLISSSSASSTSSSTTSATTTNANQCRRRTLNREQEGRASIRKVDAEEYDRKSKGPNEKDGASENGCCDACPRCLDVCGRVSCVVCKEKLARFGFNHGNSGNRKNFTWCEVRRHGTAKDAWLVKGINVYDVSEMVMMHPGGEYAIVRHAGGKSRDSRRDFDFHSKKARKMWSAFHIGTLVSCPYRTRARCEGAQSCALM